MRDRMPQFFWECGIHRHQIIEGKIVMRKVSMKRGGRTRGCTPSNCLKYLTIAVVAAALSISGLTFSGEARANYSMAQAKMAGNYESFSRSPSTKRKRYKKSKRKSTKHYGKSTKRKSYKKNRSGKYRYGSKSKKSKSAGYRKSSSKKQARKYKYKKKHTKVAALGPGYIPKPKKSLSGGGVRWVASSGCLNASLKSVVYQIAAKFGPVTVSSTCRSKKRNARVGGAKRSKHLHGNAVDFRVHSNHRAAYAYLKSHGSVGGYKHYGGGLFHIDTGPRRTW